MQTWVEFPLTKGKVALVDVQDLLILARWKWNARKTNHQWYAFRGERRLGPSGVSNYWLGMHRSIMEPPPGMVVDHINGDGLDNRRSNLRVCTPEDNSTNRRKADGTSRFIGVSRVPYQKRPWRAMVDSRRFGRLFLGNFATEEEAAMARDAKAKEVFGQFARLNFPEVGPDAHNAARLKGGE